MKITQVTIKLLNGDTVNIGDYREPFMKMKDVKNGTELESVTAKDLQQIASEVSGDDGVVTGVATYKYIKDLVTINTDTDAKYVFDAHTNEIELQKLPNYIKRHTHNIKFIFGDRTSKYEVAIKDDELHIDKIK